MGQTAGPVVMLRPITRENWRACVALEVAPDQSRYVAANAFSLAQAKGEPECVPLAVYAGETPVGFAMYALDPEDGSWWIYRLMIDHRHQRRGYGRAALRQLIARIGAEPGCRRILISFVPDNAGARRLYRGLGFVETGQRIDGEDVLALPVV